MRVTRRSALQGLASLATLPLLPARAAAAAEIDVVIVGAGAAGLAAARQLAARGRSIVILEGRDRVGGRAHTDLDSFTVPFDRGCAQLRSPRDNLWFRDIPRTVMLRRAGRGQDWRLYDDGERLDCGALEEVWESHAELDASIYRAGADGRDIAAGELVDRTDPWQDLASALLGPLEIGAELDFVSTRDYARYVPTEDDFLVATGYGALIATHGRGLPIRLNTPVSLVRWDGPRVRLETTAGTVSCRAVIVTVPTGVITAGRLRFDPALPDRTLSAFENLPLGQLNKIALEFDDGVLDTAPDTLLITRSAAGEVMQFRACPFDSNLAIGHVGGALAEQLEEAGERAAIDFALAQLKTVFGNAIAHRVRGSVATGWGSDPWSGGAISYCRPGAAQAREIIGEALDQRVFFAGEAQSITAAGTAHGAAASGVSVADRVDAMLG